jgi:hypothetical protein
MLIIVDKNTKKVVENFGTNSLFPDGNVPGIELNANVFSVLIHDDDPISHTIMSAYEYDLIFDENDNLLDVAVTKTLDEFRSEQTASEVFEAVDEDKVAMSEAIIDLDARLSELEANSNA